MVRPIVCLLWLQVLPLPGLREIVRHQPEVVTSRAIGEQLLRWNAVEKPWHLGGELGIELELGYDNWLTARLVHTFFDAIRDNIVSECQKAGVKVAVLLNRDLVWVSKGYVLPIFVHVQGISDFDAFNQESLEGIKVTLLDTAVYGELGPGGVGYATHGEPLEVRIKELPAVGDAFKKMEMTNVSSLQLELKVEFWKDKLKAAPEDTVKDLWQQATSKYWHEAHENGIDVFIAGAAYTQDHINARPFKKSEAERLSGGLSKCVTAPDFAIAQNDDGKVAFWQEGDVMGMRAVITIFSVNDKFVQSNLPSVRDKMLPKLMQDLTSLLRVNKDLCSAVPCGWSPADPRAGPLPHDTVTCGKPPDA
ncbi:Uncharacterized protein SCF082_LOCUS10405 [Durusdinium trenchii]|uniref:Uncharacterized protein n=1 Tax=Durusdinium trenchii TaxID=1381693 RepID=A0ABP0J611_9DINO